MLVQHITLSWVGEQWTPGCVLTGCRARPARQAGSSLSSHILLVYPSLRKRAEEELYNPLHMYYAWRGLSRQLSGQPSALSLIRLVEWNQHWKVIWDLGLLRGTNSLQALDMEYWDLNMLVLYRPTHQKWNDAEDSCWIVKRTRK